jgi:hypothetical protein
MEARKTLPDRLLELKWKQEELRRRFAVSEAARVKAAEPLRSSKPIRTLVAEFEKLSLPFEASSRSEVKTQVCVETLVKSFQSANVH